MCEKIVRLRIVGKSVFVELSNGAKAFIPLERICDAIKRFELCISENTEGDVNRIKC